MRTLILLVLCGCTGAGYYGSDRSLIREELYRTYDSNDYELRQLKWRVEWLENEELLRQLNHSETNWDL